jgi:hypothetical protein
MLTRLRCESMPLTILVQAARYTATLAEIWGWGS